MSKCTAGRAPKWERQGYMRRWRGQGWGDYTLRITPGPFSIIFRWNINRAVNNNPLYRTVHRGYARATRRVLVHTSASGRVSPCDQKIRVSRAANALGELKIHNTVFRAINIRTRRHHRSINYYSRCYSPSQRRRRCMAPCAGSVAATVLVMEGYARCLWVPGYLWNLHGNINGKRLINIGVEIASTV